MTGMTDQELLQASRAGSREAFCELVRRHQRMVEAAVVAAAGRGDVDDVVQDTFVTAWRRLDDLRDDGALRSWLYGIARNLARKARRTSHHVQRSDTLDTTEPTTDATPFDAVADQEREQVVATALARLPRRYREPLVLFYYEHCTVKEVAAALAMREDAAMQRLSRGRRKLGEALAARVEMVLESKVSRAAVVAGVLALLPERAASAATASATAGAVATATFASRLSTVGALIASQWRLLGATLGSAAAIAVVLVASSKSEAVAARAAARAPAQTPPTSTDADAPIPPELGDDTYRPEIPDLPDERRHAIYANLTVASDDPVESCERGARGLIQWFFDPDAIVLRDGKEYWEPNEDVMKFAEKVAKRIGQTCAIDKWPEQYVRCEGTPEELREGNVNCYPYDHFADRE
jgi:RNA polymerase sigma factor (sigma-70 family)